jgi:hypothetical protein
LYHDWGGISAYIKELHGEEFEKEESSLILVDLTGGLAAHLVVSSSLLAAQISRDGLVALV